MEAAIACVNCGAPLGGLQSRAAFISLMVMGDECIESYFLCPACDRYTVRVYHDRFLGDEDEIYSRGPFDRAEGDRLVALINTCPEPTSKYCDCEAHRSLSGMA